MSIQAKDVMKLREKTGAGMMDCKKALTESGGDMEKAVEILRKKGQQVSEKRADREANQGLILMRISDDRKRAAAIEINCETDFVARNEDFQAKGESFLNAAFEGKADNVETLLGMDVDGVSVEAQLGEMVGSIGEKIQVSRVVYRETDGSFAEYIHPGSQLGVLVEFEGGLEDEEIGRDVAMQIAAMNPIAVDRDGVDESVVAKELEIAKEQLINEGKPAEIAEKAAQGKLRRFYEERVLLEQKFVKDNTLSIRDFLKQKGAPLVRSFDRLQLGESAG